MWMYVKSLCGNKLRICRSEVVSYDCLMGEHVELVVCLIDV